MIKFATHIQAAWMALALYCTRNLQAVYFLSESLRHTIAGLQDFHAGCSKTLHPSLDPNPALIAVAGQQLFLVTPFKSVKSTPIKFT